MISHKLFQTNCMFPSKTFTNHRLINLIQLFLFGFITISLNYVKSKVIISILCGREKYLRIAHKYIDALVRKHVVDEVHLWDFTRDKKDKAYILHLTDSKDGYIYMPAERNYTYDPTNPDYWKYYYKYYDDDANLADDDILIKCDDDIIYQDIDRFEYFLNVTTHSQGLVFPNIVNNEVGAFLQQKHNIHMLVNESSFSAISLHSPRSFSMSDHARTNPFTSWANDEERAIRIHELFTTEPYRFKINSTDNIVWTDHMPVNYFGGKGSVIKKYYHGFILNNIYTDEVFLTSIAPTIFKNPNIIVPWYVVVHFSHSSQNPLKWEKPLLAKYHTLSKSILADS